MPIFPVLQEQLDRLKSMEQAYQEKLASLPRGSIREKMVNGRSYYYLMYREGTKVKTQYLKLSEHGLEELRFQLAQRKRYEQILREIRRDCRLLKRVVRGGEEPGDRIP